MSKISGLLISALVLAALLPVGVAVANSTLNLIAMAREVMDQTRDLIDRIKNISEQVQNPEYVYSPEDLGNLTIPEGLDECLDSVGGLGQFLRDLLEWAQKLIGVELQGG